VAGTEYPSELDGRRPLPLEGKSLLPVFQGQQRTKHAQLCWSVPRHHAIRMGKWKAVRPRNGGAWQLFDMDRDGTETNDLSQHEPKRVQELASRFEAWHTRVGDD